MSWRGQFMAGVLIGGTICFGVGAWVGRSTASTGPSPQDQYDANFYLNCMEHLQDVRKCDGLLKKLVGAHSATP